MYQTLPVFWKEDSSLQKDIAKLGKLLLLSMIPDTICNGRSNVSLLVKIRFTEFPSCIE
jgi:hypothetical protein